MKPVLLWIKQNPVVIIAVVLTLLSFGLLSMVSSQGAEFVTQMQSRGDEQKKLEILNKTSISVPSKKPDDPPLQTTIAVNKEAIESLTHVYKVMGDEYKNIFEMAVRFNEQNHLPMNDGLLPKPASGSSVFYAKRVYREVYDRIMREYTPDVDTEPRLHAGPPVSPEQLNVEIDKVTTEYLSSFFPVKTSDTLSETEKLELVNRRRNRLVEVLQQRATSIHLYAQTNPEASDFPFKIDPWSLPAKSEKPKIEDIWESQMNLWIQLDIAEALKRSNKVHDPQSNVLTAPIKRLLSVDVVPGYVGLNPGDLGNPDQKLPDDFAAAPTGRRSTQLWDIRHVRVTLHADFQQLPEFFNVLAGVNFMTVLQMTITDLDEYKLLQSGYMYGNGDMVEVEMLIETVWLRDWTKKYMPPTIKTKLGVPETVAPAPAAVAPAE